MDKEEKVFKRSTYYRVTVESFYTPNNYVAKTVEDVAEIVRNIELDRSVKYRPVVVTISQETLLTLSENPDIVFSDPRYEDGLVLWNTKDYVGPLNNE